MAAQAAQVVLKLNFGRYLCYSARSYTGWGWLRSWNSNWGNVLNELLKEQQGLRNEANYGEQILNYNQRRSSE